MDSSDVTVGAVILGKKIKFIGIEFNFYSFGIYMYCL